MTLLATCNSHKRSLDIEIKDPGSTSDYLSFYTSELLKKVSEEGFLKGFLCIYGDNAFINTFFMATPFKGFSTSIKDTYNFFHSQLRINIECSFGILVHRWGYLRRALPMNIIVERISALVRCLCILQYMIIVLIKI